MGDKHPIDEQAAHRGKPTETTPAGESPRTGPGRLRLGPAGTSPPATIDLTASNPPGESRAGRRDDDREPQCDASAGSMTERLLTEEQAARELGCSVDELRSWRAQHRGPTTYNVSARTVRYSSESVAEYRTRLARCA